ncbi:MULTISPECIES: peptidoglycan recognition protein family protein [Streptomyces]|uniref:peptidoglycan recognition protein family protein n=1 Tax=Streptomyces TaxID=1883 RepID=UPI002248F04F|nr:peptidoglycan recognition protein [Streptomyces sp. JHD 1]MCX2971610.1 peptidoglycan recognition protein [Streptomyces sp. JHD 1]
MRALFASSIGVVCSAALLASLAPTALATDATRQPAAAAGAPGPSGNRSLPLNTLDPGAAADRAGGGALAGLPRRTVEPFSMVGVVWEDQEQELHGRPQVRTRDARTGVWSGWQDLLTHTDDAPDPDSAERRLGTVRGSTAPLWVGPSDGVAVRVLPAAGPDSADPAHHGPGHDAAHGAAHAAHGAGTPIPGLPAGLRLELVDPGAGPGTLAPDGRRPAAPEEREGGFLAPEEPADAGTADTGTGPHAAAFTTRAAAPSDQTPGVAHEALAARLAGLGPAASALSEEWFADLADGVFGAGPADTEDADGARDLVGPRPGIVTRSGWGADESLREREYLYTDTVKAAFVHHTAMSNNYTCAEAPAVIRGIYKYHVSSLGWRDVGYNFFVDKCGKIYEGRAGGVRNAVMGAHTYGFNHDSTGVAVLGTYSSTAPSKDAREGVAKLLGWKLGIHRAGDPGGSVTLTSGGGKYPKGRKVTMKTVSGHRDGFNTECPGEKLYAALPAIRDLASRLQGR